MRPHLKIIFSWVLVGPDMKSDSAGEDQHQITVLLCLCTSFHCSRGTAFVLWVIDPLLNGDSVNKGLLLGNAATYMHATIEEPCFL
jgi:hypothetical protein